MWGKSLGQLQTPSINHPACLSTDVGAAVTVRSKCARTWALHTSARRWVMLPACVCIHKSVYVKERCNQMWGVLTLIFKLHFTSLILHKFYITFWPSIHMETTFYSVKTELIEGALPSGYIWKCCFHIVVLTVKMEIFQNFAHLKLSTFSHVTHIVLVDICNYVQFTLIAKDMLLYKLFISQSCKGDAKLYLPEEWHENFIESVRFI